MSRNRAERHILTAAGRLGRRLIALLPPLLLAALLVPCLALGATTATDDDSEVPNSERKNFVPTITKEISEDAKDWKDAIDSSSFMTVYYRVIGTMPEYTEPYDSYPYSIVDKHEDTILVYMDSVKIVRNHDGNEEDVAPKFRIEIIGGELVASVIDLKTTFPDMSVDDTFTMTYEACLSDAPDTGFGNPNENACCLLYMTDEPEETPQFSYGTGATAETPSVVTFDYSYVVDISEYLEGSEVPLGGVSFSIQDDDGKWRTEYDWSDDQSEAQVFMADEDGHVVIPGTGDGDFTLTEVTAPDGYEPVGPISLTITRSEDGDQQKLSAKVDGDAELKEVNPKTGYVHLRIKRPVIPESQTPEVPPAVNSGTPASPLPRAIVDVAKIIQMGGGTPVLVAVVIASGATVAFFIVRRRRENR